MKKIELLHLRAIRQAHELTITLRQLESEAQEFGTVDTLENVSTIVVDADDVYDSLKENPVMLSETT